uniref:Uncharacterized protein n=1 Tax=Phasianus colchicus TaxID=9054 RepID=A0A669PL22_PHACC
MNSSPASQKQISAPHTRGNNSARLCCHQSCFSSSQRTFPVIAWQGEMDGQRLLCWQYPRSKI